MALLMTPPISGPYDPWIGPMKEAVPGLEIRTMDDIGDPADIEFLVIGKPTLKDLPELPNLRLMMTMLAGVDGFVNSPHLPKGVPLVKLEPIEGGDHDFTEYAILHVLRHHRDLPYYAEQQSRHEWKPRERKTSSERKVGVLGYGTLGKPIAIALKNMGFDVAAWARNPRSGEPVEVFAGEEGFEPFMARTEIAVCLLPLTPETDGILNSKAFGYMPKGAAIISMGRGANVHAEDLMAALESGQLAGATLDVTVPEPLPADSPLWDQKNLTILPHVARRPPISKRMETMKEHMRRLEAGEPMLQEIDRDAGY